MNKEDFEFKLQKLELNGTPDKKDIVIVKFTEDVGADSFKSLQTMLGSIKEQGEFENVNFVVLPKHISMTRLEDEDLEKLGFKRIEND